MKNSLSKIGFCAFIVCLLASRGMATPLLNPGFELGLSSWDHDSNTYPIGTSRQTIGTGGKSAANLGTFDQVGSYVSQRVCVVPGLSYSLTLSIGANGAGVVGRIAGVRCFVVANGGQVVLDRNFAVASVGAAQGGLGFQRITTSFSVPLDTIEILLQFSDASPAQGKGVDLMRVLEQIEGEVIEVIEGMGVLG